MKRIFTIVASFAFVMSALVSCNDLKDIEGRVDVLENRIEALENICKTLNENVEALKTFLDGKKTITNFTEANGVYTIELSDGSKITLKQGSEGSAVMPEIAVDKDGYWTVNGKQILSNGKPVPATGNDGATPIFGVDKDGYWTVKYSEEETPKQVLGADGKPVKAVAQAPGTQTGSDKFFENVEVINDKIEITLKGGKKYSLPIIPNFICAIECSEAQPVIFTTGEQKTFNVTLENVAQTIIYTPTGWNASLQGNNLTIEAPSVMTKATANTREDVSILAISNTGFAAISKIRVQVIEKPVVQGPSATVTVVEPAETNALTFKVITNNVAHWFYHIQPASEAAPAPEMVMALGTIGKSEIVKIDGLKADTEYTIYILPLSADSNMGKVATVTAKTLPEPVVTLPGLIAKYNEGLDVVIGGITVNKKTYGEANYISATSTDKTIKSGVNFVEPDANAIFGADGIKLPLFVAGNTEGTRTPIKTNGQVGLLGDATVQDNIFVIENAEIVIENIAAAKYVFASNADFAIDKVCISNCKVDMIDHVSMMYVAATRPVNSFIMKDSDIKVSQHIADKTINILQTSGTYNMTEVNFTNNVLWSPKDAEWVSLLHNRNATIEKLTVSHNSFINIYPQASYAFFQIKNLKSGSISNNLLYLENYEKLITSYCGIVREMDGACDATLYDTFVKNYAIYGNTIPTKRMKVGQNAKTGQIFNKKKAESSEIFDYGTGSTNFDLVNGIFKPKNATYGATRK